MQQQLEPLTTEKLAHFIEVGFLIDSKNYRHVDTYKEKSFENILVKYLYEFSDLIDDSKTVNLQHKLKSSLYDNFGLFNEIQPMYISMNLGRNISPFADDGSLP